MEAPLGDESSGVVRPALWSPKMNSRSKKLSAASDEPSGRATHFGFRQVAEEDKAGLVHDVFTHVAGRYDLMNDLMSGGLHRVWKSAMIDWLSPPRNERAYAMLDVAGGTGDIAFRCLERAGQGTYVTVCDINQDMLEVGRSRAAAHPYAERVEFTCGDAEALPFPDASFDSYTIAFGIRNVTHIEQALAEAFRVLKAGGRFLCLEFSQVTVPGLDKIYDAYSFGVIPRMGRVVTGDADPYQYLVESIRRFPDQARFKSMIEAVGFARASYRNLSGGIAALHSGWRI
jgi:demethylmenaquinone methyltransferase/2-methoxy-6-polyprenyl-1,4-benzoquinol methylase